MISKEEKNSSFGNISLLVSALLVSWVAAELALRIMSAAKAPEHSKNWVAVPEESWIQYDSSLGWDNQASVSKFLTLNGKSIPVTLNEQAMRSKTDLTLKKKALSTKRIYLLGDSFSFGFGVSDENSLSEKLKAAIPQSEVLNLSVVAYGIDQMFLKLRKMAWEYQPDHVVIVIYPEDFWRALRAYTDAGYSKPYFQIHNNKLVLNNVPVPEKGKARGNQFPGIMSSKNSFFQGLKTVQLFQKALSTFKKRMKWEDPDTTPDWILGRAILKQMLEEIRLQKIPATIVLTPPIRWIQGTDEPIRQSLKRFCEREKTTFIDLTETFRMQCKQPEFEDCFIPADFHWTEKGTELAVEAIAKAIQR